MADAVTTPIKYLFLDVVAFTTNRSVEAQSDIVHALNVIVLKALAATGVPSERTVLLPTGDGLCIALVNVEDPYDVHVRLAVALVGGIHMHNATEPSDQRRFAVRIGINANIDNLVMDISGNRNVAGAGINMASRVMSLADGNQVLVSAAVHDGLKYREAYQTAFREYWGTVKHNLAISVFQLIEPHEGLSVDTPRAFQERIRVAPPMSDATAAYIASAFTYRDFVITASHEGSHRAAIVWLWYRIAGCLRAGEGETF